MTEQADPLEELRAVWRALPAWRRPIYAFRTAYSRGLFWVEIMSALVALMLVIPALQDVDRWPVGALGTRIALVAVVSLQAIQLLLLHPYSRWVRLLANAFAASWWCGCASILFLLQETSLAFAFLVLFTANFFSLVNLAGSKL